MTFFLGYTRTVGVYIGEIVFLYIVGYLMFSFCYRQLTRQRSLPPGTPGRALARNRQSGWHIFLGYWAFLTPAISAMWYAIFFDPSGVSQPQWANNLPG